MPDLELHKAELRGMSCSLHGERQWPPPLIFRPGSPPHTGRAAPGLPLAMWVLQWVLWPRCPGTYSTPLGLPGQCQEEAGQ